MSRVHGHHHHITRRQVIRGGWRWLTGSDVATTGIQGCKFFFFFFFWVSSCLIKHSLLIGRLLDHEHLQRTTTNTSRNTANTWYGNTQCYRPTCTPLDWNEHEGAQDKHVDAIRQQLRLEHVRFYFYFICFFVSNELFFFFFFFFFITFRTTYEWFKCDDSA